MATEFTLKGIPEEELYVNKTPSEKIKLRQEMIKMAQERGIKPTARYYKTYPSTVRRWVKISNQNSQLK